LPSRPTTVVALRSEFTTPPRSPRSPPERG
jgi:hypothetical protein